MRVIKAKWIFPILLVILITASSLAVPETFCYTPGITPADSTQYILGSSVQAAIDAAGETDIYAFEIAETASVEIFTQGDTDTFGTLKDASGNGIGIDDDSSAGKNFVIRAVLSAGVYTIEIRDYYDDLVGEYTLNSAVTAIRRDNAGNTRQEASALDLAGASLDAAVDYAGDIDFFTFTAGSKSLFSANTLLNTDTFGSLYAADGRLLLENDDGYAGKNFLLSATLDPGTYYLSVREYYPERTGAYTLVYALTAFSDDYGNDIKNASAISLGQSVDAAVDYPGDADCFRFAVEQRRTVEISTQGNTDMFGELYDPGGNLLDSQDDISSTNKNFSVKRVLDPGIYYIRARDYYADRTGSYSLQVKAEGSEIDQTVVNLDVEDKNTCAFVYSGGRYAYVGCNTTPARIVKFDVETMMRICALDLPAHENRNETRVAALIAIDPETVIHASYTNPCVFTKIDGNTMTVIGTLQGLAEDVNDKYIRGLAYDGQYVYAATDSTPSKIIKIDPVTMTRVDSVTFEDRRLSCCYSIVICGDDLVGVCESEREGGSAIFRLKLSDYNFK